MEEWKTEASKSELLEILNKHLMSGREHTMNRMKREIQQAEDNTRSLARDLKHWFDVATNTRKEIERMQQQDANKGVKLYHDLNNLMHHDKIEKVMIRGGKYWIHTTTLYCYHDQHPARYHIGKFVIELNPENTSVKFTGDTPRRSYWSQHDPHPHVNGTNGYACLGNLAPTIAELCSQYEIYALVMVCLEFLESVNTSDPAGANIIHWDEVDENGQIIKEGAHPHTWQCECCEDEFDENEYSNYTVYQSYVGDREGTGEWGQERTVCESCRDEYYIFHEDLQSEILNGYCNFTDEEEEDDPDTAYEQLLEAEMASPDEEASA